MEQQIWQPMQANTQRLFPASPNHPFFLKTHPTAWDFVYLDVKARKKGEFNKKGFFLPTMSLERIVPGVNGINQVQVKGTTEIGDASARIGKLQTQHWTYLDPARYNYVGKYPVSGGHFHMPTWIKYEVKFGRKIKKVDFDEKYQFAIGLLQNGIIPEPVPDFWEDKIKIIERRKVPYQSDPHPTPAVEAKLREIDGLLKDMRAAVKAYQSKGLKCYDAIVFEAEKAEILASMAPTEEPKE